MARSLFHTISGFFWLALDSVFQRLINWRVERACPLFDATTKQLVGKNAVVTGANTGLGFETARWLIANGANVILACRNPDKAEAAVAALRAEERHASVSVEQLDLADFTSVRACAERLKATSLHMLVLNAGVMGMKRTDVQVSEPHMKINHTAHSLLLLLLAPTLRLHHGRVVSVSSYASLLADLRHDDIHLRTRSTGWFTAYANSKLAQLLFARALEKRTNAFRVFCVHPGESTTDVTRYIGSIFVWLHHHIVGPMLLTPREAARTIVYAAASNDTELLSRGGGGVLLHAVRRIILLPARLLNDDEADWMWSTTLNLIDMSETEAMQLINGDTLVK